MVDFSRTYMAVEKLLALLRCDHCNAPLHQPFTTGVCEHILCTECRLGGTASKRNETCPVCRVPVRPKDCQVHPQIAQLVLVARRLKKLTLPNNVEPYIIPDPENDKPVIPSTEECTDSNGFAVPAVKDHLQNASVEPRVVLKRAYSKSSTANVSTETSYGPNVIPKRGLSSERESSALDCVSLTSVAQTNHSCLSNVSSSGTSSVSIIRKPCLDRSRASVSTSVRSRSNVRRLPAYPKTAIRSASSGAESKENTVDHSSVVLHHMITNPAIKHGVNSDSLEMVLKQATRVHHTRQSLKEEACKDMTSSTNIPTTAPCASPENSCLTDVTHISPSTTKECTSLVTLRRLDDSSSPARTDTILPPTRPRSTRPKKQTKKLSHEEDGRSNTLRSRSSSSSRLAQFLNKLRPNSKGESALHRAAIRGNLEQVKEYLASGMSPDLRDHAGWTPLHEAVLHGHRDIAEALLNAGATVDIPGGPDLDTPLHDAVQNAQTACCELLLARGADPILPNGAGFTPLQLVDLGLSKLTGSNVRVKQSPRGSNNNTASSAARDALMSIRDTIMRSISKRHPLTVRKPNETNELLTGTPCAPSKHLQMMETLNPALSVPFKERRRLRPVLMGTGLNRAQQLTFSRVAAMIRAQVVNSISPDVTHVITGATSETSAIDQEKSKGTSKRSSSISKVLAKSESTELVQTSCPRTLKFLNAVLQGCWVLSFDWIETCAHVKMRVEEEGFEVTGCSTTPHSGAPRRARLAREAGSLGLFYGFRFCFLGEFEYPIPPRNELARLVRTGGGMVLFCRERCSPLRLARLAIESAQPNESSPWELASTDVKNDDELGFKTENSDHQEDGDSDDGERSFLGPKQHILPVNLFVPLFVVYGSHRSSGHQTTPYPIQVMSDALSLIRPRSSGAYPVESSSPPLSAVPASWILDCAAEYTILPPPTF